MYFQWRGFKMGERFYLQQLEGARNMHKNYTNEQVAHMIKLYGEGNSDAERRVVIEKLAHEMGKTVGSIRAKLVAVGHYIKLSTKTAKPKQVSKDELVVQIQTFLGIEGLSSLKNATKVDLEVILQRLQVVSNIQSDSQHADTLHTNGDGGAKRSQVANNIVRQRHGEGYTYG